MSGSCSTWRPLLSFSQDRFDQEQILDLVDIDRRFVDRYNHQLIDIHRINSENMEAHLHHLRAMIMHHVEATGSEWGEMILEDYRTFLPKFWLVKPQAAELGSLIESLRQAA